MLLECKIENYVQRMLEKRPDKMPIIVNSIILKRKETLETEKLRKVEDIKFYLINLRKSSFSKLLL